MGKLSIEQINLIKSEMAKFLDQRPWDYFATLTASHVMKLTGWRRRVTIFHEKLIFQEQNAQMFWVAEKFRSGDNFHLHAFIKSDLPPIVISQIWNMINNWKGKVSNSKFNRTDIQKRNLSKRGGDYLMKDINYGVKELLDYDYDYYL